MFLCQLVPLLPELQLGPGSGKSPENPPENPPAAEVMLMLTEATLRFMGKVASVAALGQLAS